MPTKRCDATINGKPVKVMLVDKGWKKMYFAKPKKGHEVETPHFEQITSGSIEVHQHSSDCKQFRVMSSSEIYSGSFSSGTSFVQNKGMDIAVLPMYETANGIALDFSSSGSYVNVSSGSQWVIYALGKWGEWQDVPKNDKTKTT